MNGHFPGIDGKKRCPTEQRVNGSDDELRFCRFIGKTHLTDAALARSLSYQSIHAAVRFEHLAGSCKDM